MAVEGRGVGSATTPVVGRPLLVLPGAPRPDRSAGFQLVRQIERVVSGRGGAPQRRADAQHGEHNERHQLARHDPAPERRQCVQRAGSIGVGPCSPSPPLAGTTRRSTTNSPARSRRGHRTTRNLIDPRPKRCCCAHVPQRRMIVYTRPAGRTHRKAPVYYCCRRRGAVQLSTSLTLSLFFYF